MSAVTEATYAETPRNGMAGAAQSALGVVNALLAVSGHVAIEALSAILPPRVDRARRVLIHLAGRPQHLRHQPHRSRYRLGPDPVGHAALSWC